MDGLSSNGIQEGIGTARLLRKNRFCQPAVRPPIWLHMYVPNSANTFTIHSFALLLSISMDCPIHDWLLLALSLLTTSLRLQLALSLLPRLVRRVLIRRWSGSSHTLISLSSLLYWFELLYGFNKPLLPRLWKEVQCDPMIIMFLQGGAR